MTGVCLCNVCALWGEIVKFVWCMLCVSMRCVYSEVCVNVASGICLRYVHFGLSVKWSARCDSV